MTLRILLASATLACAPVQKPVEKPPSDATVRTGLDVVLSDSIGVLRGKRVGLITNHTGIDASGHRNVDLLFHVPGVRLVALFAPEHGIAGVVEGGENIGAATDSATRLPVYSLYGATRVPTADMLRGIDVLVYDIQDVGARVYTYVWTMALAAEAAGKSGIPFVVLDRPNPIRADIVGGNVLEAQYRSFVGQYEVALRYGLTAGELLRYLVATGRVHANVTVIPMQGYRRSMWFSETSLPWINPSPNIRDEETATLYPGTVFFEATNLSEGRGTDAPLKQVGASWLTDAAEIARALNDMHLPGLRFDARDHVAVAAGQKEGGKTIPMLRMAVTDRDSADAITAAVWMLRFIRQRHPEDFRWQAGAGIERLAGTADLRRVVDGGSVAEVQTLLTRWAEQARAFQDSTRVYWLYR
jgi:uncharacterized protein YbbC (DUF1343 family)